MNAPVEKAVVVTKPPVKLKSLGIPRELRDIAQWAPWKWDWDEKRGKADKVPINPVTGTGASTKDQWWDFATALKAMQRMQLDGLGLNVTFADVTAIDVDDCVTGHTEDGAAQLSELAEKIKKGANTYAELSPSGKGIRMMLLGRHGADFTSHRTRTAAPRSRAWRPLCTRRAPRASARRSPWVPSARGCAQSPSSRGTRSAQRPSPAAQHQHP